VVTELRVAARNVIRHRRHTLMAFIAIVFGITGLFIALGFTDWGLNALRESFIRTQFAHIRITAKGYFDQGQVPVGKYLLPKQLPNIEAIRADARIKAIFPRLSFTGLVSKGERTVGFLGEGIEPRAERDAGMAFELTAGQGIDQQDGILLGEGLAKYLQIKPGERLTLTSNTRSGGINAIELPVAGVFSTGNRNYDDYNLRIPIEQARRLLRVQGVHTWMMVLHDTAQTERVIADLEKHLPPSQFDRVHWNIHADYVNKMAGLYDGFTKFMKAVVAIIIALGIGNTLSMAVMERTAEIGTTLALGANRQRVLRNFLYEGLSLAIIGSLLGLLIAYVIAVIVTAIGPPMPPPPGMTRPWRVHINVTPSVIGNTLLVAIPSVLIASLYPAWRAASQQIVDALRKAR
jgi:putative ABC transport system permease protein